MSVGGLTAKSDVKTVFLSALRNATCESRSRNEEIETAKALDLSTAVSRCMEMETVADFARGGWISAGFYCARRACDNWTVKRTSRRRRRQC